MKPALPQHQHGVILVVTLIALVLMMIAGISLIRSFDTSLLLAGNMSFRRGLDHQAERGLAVARSAMGQTSAPLGPAAARIADNYTNNYSSVILVTDNSGIPQVLLSDSSWTTAGMSTTADIIDGDITIRYVIDRLCNATGLPDKALCVSMPTFASSGDGFHADQAGGGNKPIYRISIRVRGPRNTESYVQETVQVLSDI